MTYIAATLHFEPHLCSISVPFSQFQSNSIHLGPLWLIRSNNPIRSIRFISIHFSQIQSYSVHLGAFGPIQFWAQSFILFFLIFRLKSMKFYFIWVKFFSFRLKNSNKIGIGNRDMGPKKTIKIINIQKITLKLNFQ